MTTTQKAIIRTLLYFDIFGHPLNKSELFSLVSVKPTHEDFEEALRGLFELHIVGSETGYFFLTNGSSSVTERIRKQVKSARYHRISRIISLLIYFHPFVRGVLVSGSLSKSVRSKKDDIDFFIITEPGRLWLCRTSLMLFKKIFLLNSKKYFCLNYFVDTETLEIPEKNIFTATEISFLIPCRNLELCGKFFNSNQWILTFFPNLTIDLASCRRGGNSMIKSIPERLLRGKYGDRLDSYCLDLYRKRARKKYGLTRQDQFDLNFRSEKNVSKYHPNGYQHLIMQHYGLKISEFQAAYQVDLSLL